MAALVNLYTHADEALDGRIRKAEQRLTELYAKRAGRVDLEIQEGGEPTGKWVWCRCGRHYTLASQEESVPTCKDCKCR